MKATLFHRDGSLKVRATGLFSPLFVLSDRNALAKNAYQEKQIEYGVAVVAIKYALSTGCEQCAPGCEHSWRHSVSIPRGATHEAGMSATPLVNRNCQFL